jgi:16S rRNA (uracil1498-N3)-methyltransferase
LRLPEGEARHVLKVLRGRRGDAIEIVDSTRRLFAGGLQGGSEVVVFEALPVLEDAAEVSLYQAVPKGGRMDLVIEKATEVGAIRIVPLVTRRGIAVPGGGRVERWRRIAEAAARQSLRTRVPEVLEPVPFVRAVQRAGENGVLLHNESGLVPLEDLVGSPVVSLFVGPEGGWSEEELRLSGEAGLARAQLGPYRLRSETAGVVAVARAWAALESRNVVERR